jgi:hypothetical protein
MPLVAEDVLSAAANGGRESRQPGSIAVAVCPELDCRPNPIILKGKNMSHLGNCFCGAVKLEVTGSPEAMGYCHCSSCRSWSGGPVNAFSLSFILSGTPNSHHYEYN